MALNRSLAVILLHAEINALVGVKGMPYTMAGVLKHHLLTSLMSESEWCGCERIWGIIVSLLVPYLLSLALLMHSLAWRSRSAAKSRTSLLGPHLSHLARLHLLKASSRIPCCPVPGTQLSLDVSSVWKTDSLILLAYPREPLSLVVLWSFLQC